MRPPLLVLDTHYLAHRAFHVSKDLSWGGVATGVIYGFLKSVISLGDEFQTDRMAFCFEHPILYRRNIYPAYKRKRYSKEYTKEEEKQYADFKGQIKALRKRYLSMIGFRNVFCVKGMESDDVMAAIALSIDPSDSAILVTADSDLYQCLRSNIHIFSPQKRKILTAEWFQEKYGIPPRKWALVKAIAGCTGDEVRGVGGVGEVTALQYVKGELKDTSTAFKAITSCESRAIVVRNRRLVQLPYEGCPMPEIVDDKVDGKGWRDVCRALGMRSLISRPPLAIKRAT